MTKATDNAPLGLPVTPELLRDWPLPPVADSKYGRGQVVVVGGAPRSPGAAMLAGIASLRVGAGRLTLAVGSSIAGQVAVALPESGVVFLDETSERHVLGSSIRFAESDLRSADVVVVGPGLDDAPEAADLLRALPDLLEPRTVVVLDAYALGVLAEEADVAAALSGRLVLTPNTTEASRLLGHDFAGESDIAQIADTYGATVSCQGTICEPGGGSWQIATGRSGLATSGSGDVLAGAIAGLCARGATPSQAAVWATHAHAAAGDRLSVAVGPLGYLASELLPELPRVFVEIGTN
ncbi:NAD(P)H-hydrate dehydratase [Glaciihabitans sp. dw_435]|uniref:NAD(P)H-hydrate dehydratase n=1 Tax=Glaciihabitans sp. dw_435 TaxID=2720081 RepID=UPI001BD3ED1D|nr:NAD(P)H-hydrate dehydratase [Glaciihabitans sp. dw_435]